MSVVSARQHLRSAIVYLLVVQHTRSTGLLCGQPVALELSTRQHERSGSWQGQLQTSADLQCTVAFSVLEMFQDDTLYKFSYLLIGGQSAHTEFHLDNPSELSHMAFGVNGSAANVVMVIALL